MQRSKLKMPLKELISDARAAIYRHGIQTRFYIKRSMPTFEEMRRMNKTPDAPIDVEILDLAEIAMQMSETIERLVKRMERDHEEDIAIFTDLRHKTRLTFWQKLKYLFREETPQDNSAALSKAQYSLGVRIRSHQEFNYKEGLVDGH